MRRQLVRGDSKCFQDRFWLPHKSDVWVPAQIAKQVGEHITLDADNGDSVLMNTKDVAQLHKVYSEQLAGVEDIISMAHVTEGALLYTVRVRYTRKQIYTRVARTLIAVNPFSNLSIYSSAYLQQYANCNNSLELPPHIFGIGQDAIRGLRTTSCDQAVLISGESGAGKTESAKLIMSFVANAMRSNGSNLMEQVLLTNPVLEAFGNAMTLRNNNSSRFGKWQDLRFSESMESMGCALSSYLLETTRVSGPAKDERNFHVFFQLLGARKEAEIVDLQLDGPEGYRYLRGCQREAPGINDSKDFLVMRDALIKLGYSSSERTELFRVVAAVLTLGNTDFLVDGEGSKVASLAPVHRAAELIGVKSEQLEQVMLVRKFVVNGEETVALNRIDQARAVRDALARLLYGRLFQWLIQKMNTLLAVDCGEASTSRLFGLLDIAGFENFDHNSLEQLLINLSNEHLQQQFNHHVFKMEQEECAKEGVDIADLKGFHDNADILVLIDAKGGVLDLLDESCVTCFSNMTDSTFASKLLSSHRDHPQIVSPKIATGVPNFAIKHFAGCVSYSCEGWLEKNIEKLPQETACLLQASSLSLVRGLGGHVQIESKPVKHSNAVGPRVASNRTKSVSGAFRLSLRDLMAKINAAQPHYVRCVKPNAAKVPGKFEAPNVMEQLLFSGVFATVQIRQRGYAHRIPHEEFVFLYSCILERHVDQPIRRARAWSRSTHESVAAKARALVEALPSALASLGHEFDKDAFAVGHTKVFAKFSVQQAIEDARQRALHKVATQIQSLFRGFMVRRPVAEMPCDDAGWRRGNATEQNLVTKSEFAHRMAEQRAAMEQEFAAKLTEERARVELEFTEKLVAEQARARTEIDKARVAAEMAQRAEKKLEARLATERASAEKQYAAKLDMVTAELVRERVAIEEECARNIAAQEEKAKAAKQLAAEKAAAEAAAALQLEKERGEFALKLQSQRSAVMDQFEQTLAAERAVAEQELEERLNIEREIAKEALERRLIAERVDAEQVLAQRLVAEHTKAERDLADRLVAEHVLAEENLKETMNMERATLEVALVQRISSEKSRAEAAEKLAEQHRQAEQTLARQLADEKAAAQKELKEQLAAERDAAQKQLEARLSLERMMAERDVARKLMEEHALAEQQLSRSFSEQRRVAELALEQRIVAEQERADAAEQLAAQCVEAEQISTRRSCLDHANSLKETEHRLSIEHAEAMNKLAQRLAADHANAERAIADQLIGEHMSAQSKLQETMDSELTELEQTISSEQARANAAEKIVDHCLEATAQLDQRLAREKAAAQAEMEEQVFADQETGLEGFEARLLLERVIAGREMARMFEEHAIIKQRLLQKLSEGHGAANDALADQTLMACDVTECSEKTCHLSPPEQLGSGPCPWRHLGISEVASAASSYNADHSKLFTLTSTRSASGSLAETLFVGTPNSEEVMEDEQRHCRWDQGLDQAPENSRLLSAELPSAVSTVTESPLLQLGRALSTVHARTEAAEQMVGELLCSHARLERRLTLERDATEDQLKKRIAAEQELMKTEIAAQLHSKQAANEKTKARRISESLSIAQSEYNAAHDVANKAIEKLVEVQSNFDIRLAAEREAAEREFSDKLALEQACKLALEPACVRRAHRHRSIPGLVISERSQILSKINVAVDEFDVDVLEKLLDRADEDGLDDGDLDEDHGYGILWAARMLFDQLHDEDSLLQILEELKSEAAVRPAPLRALKRLLNLAAHLLRTNLRPGEDGARDASVCVQRALMYIADERGLNTIFASESAIEVQLAMKAFGELQFFENMKNADEWEGHERPQFPLGRRRSSRASFGSRRPSVANRRLSRASVLPAYLEKLTSMELPSELTEQTMVNYSKECIAGSLTRSPVGCQLDEFNVGASLMFFNLLTCMGDKFAQDCMRTSAGEAFVQMAQSQPEWRDELYIQMMKQLSDNPSPVSKQRGWELFRDLCQNAPPDGMMIEFVRAFIRRSAPALEQSHGQESQAVAAMKDSMLIIDGVYYWSKTAQRATSILQTIAWPASWVLGSWMSCNSRQ